MALKPLNSVAGFSVGETPSNVIYANGDVTANNFIATAKSNLGPIGNVFVSGGSNGQVVQTDGAGNLSFVTIDTWKIQNGNSNVQVLANSNVTVTISGNANIATFSTLGLDVNGYVQVQGNVIANGNVSANNYIVTPGSTDLIVAPGSVLTRFYSDVNPYSDGGYDLGNGLARWNNVFAYYSNVEGNVDINDTLTVSSNVNFTSAGNVSLGPVGNLHITGGSGGQVLQTDGAGNLSWTSTANISEIHNGNSNVEIPVTNGNVYINANSGVDKQWAFGTDGTLTFPLVNSETSIQIQRYGMGNLVGYSDGGWVLGEYNGTNYGTEGIRISPGIEGNVEVILPSDANAATQPLQLNNYSTGNVRIQSNSYYWNFDATGNTQFPSIGSADLGNFVTANYANFRNDLVVQGNIANANNIIATNNITSDTANVTGNLVAGNVDGGNLVKANNFSTNGSGGDITLTGGNVQGSNVVIANSFTSNGGTIDFATNNPNVQLGNVANVHIGGGSASQYLQTDGAGNLTWTTADTTTIANGTSNVSIPVANGNVNTSVNGNANVFVVTGTGANVTGTLDVSGNLTSANANLGNLVTANYANLSNDLVVQGNIANANNISITNNLEGNTANFSGNITSLNANLGNLITANYANFTNDLVVQGNIANANNISVTNNITAGSANVTNDLDVGGNIVTGTGSGGNISGVNYITANVANITNVVNTGAIANGTSNIRLAQNSNVTISVNNLSNIFTFSDVGANVIGYVSANGNGTFGAIYSNTVTAQSGNLTLSSEQAGNSYIQLRTFGDGTVDVGNVRITSLATPNASTDAATKQYVDDVAQGLNIHDAALAATANTLANLTGGTITYNNGASGVGANLVLSGTPTKNYLSANVFDGNVTAVTNSRILVKNEANAAFNGIYVVSNSTVLTRADDFNSVPEIEAGDFVFVQDGSTYNDSGWVQTSVVTTIGTDPITWTQFSGAGTYQAGSGLTLTGTVFSVNVDNVTTEISGGNVIVKASAQLTTPNIGAATGTSLDLTGNLIAGNVNSNATITGVDINLTGNVLAGNINSNAFITGVDGNLTGNLTVAGNISGANVIFANSFTSNGGVVDFKTNNANVQLGNIGNVHIYGGTTNQVLTTDGSGNLAWSSGSQVANGTSSVSIPVADGNINMSVGGNANILVVTGTGANITGTLGVTGNITGNVLIANNLTSTRVPYVGSSNNLTDTTNLTWDNPNQVLKVGAGGTELGGDSGYGYIQTSTANVATQIKLGNTAVNWATVTTTSVSANQTIASYSVTGVTGIEFLVKAVDSGGKYSIATVQAVTDGTNVDYATFGTVQLGGYTGSLAVNVVGGFVRLQVTPSSGNSTVWTTQYRLI